ncbi:hypothetical protein [Streptomyces sp. enrichment culture]|uniref:hypothetical protein n=1 Tax=Streptomyces sp. enrichment culture TaxID=1795815 RepID=UPI003F5556CC
MGGFLSELGKRLAEQWMSLLVLPGALYLAFCAVAHSLGHAHALDVGRLTERITSWADAPAVGTVGGQVVLLAAVLAAAAMTGLVAQAAGSVIERLHLAAGWRAWPPGLRQLARWRTARRRSRWERAASAWHRQRKATGLAHAAGEPVDPAPLRAAHAAMTRIAAEAPDRPTWSGDRVHAAAVRMDRDHHLDFAAVWPHLWLILPDGTRAEITAARQALARAGTLGAWALLYLALTPWWWPAAVVGAGTALTSWRRTRAAADTFGLLLEAVTRLYARDLAGQLGAHVIGLLTRPAGDSLSRLVTPSPPPRPRDVQDPG